MAKAKLQQIKLISGKTATQPPFPGGWVLAVFDALHSFAPAFAAEYELPIRRRTQTRIKSAEVVKQSSYVKIENKLVEIVAALFPKVSAVNGFAKKYVDEYFRLWRQSAEIGPTWVKHFGIDPGESCVLGRALVRDLVLRLCYLESCERKLNKQNFSEAELDLLRFETPVQVYSALISSKAELHDISQEKLAEQLNEDDRVLRKIKSGEKIPRSNFLRGLIQADAGHRLAVGIGFVHQLLKNLRLHNSLLRHEFLAVASVFFRYHPAALEAFAGRMTHMTESGVTEFEVRDFEGYAAFGDNLLLHPGFEELWQEMPDSLWRCHLYTLQFARIADLAQAYYQFASKDSDEKLEKNLSNAEDESDGCPHQWMQQLRSKQN